MFCVGDTVCVRPDLRDAMDEHPGIVSWMLRYAGVECVVTYVGALFADKAVYRLSCDGGEWLWSDGMILPPIEEVQDMDSEDISELLGGMISV